MTITTLPLNQIAISSIDLKRSECWWRQGLGFLASGGTRLFRGKDLSDVAGLPNAAATVRWLVGQDEWLQIELWQYERPLPQLMASDYAPNHQGFSRCGVWVEDFDTTLESLAQLDSYPLTEPLGELGRRRVCVRDPDGIFVELFERDPIEGAERFNDCAVAFRSITVTTLDLDASIKFASDGLGLTQRQEPLHQPEHQGLWNLSGAQEQSVVYRSGSMLLEFVQYQSPVGVCRAPDARLNDQGILNVAFGDSQSLSGVEIMREQAIRAGASPSRTANSPLGGAVYMTDPQGFSFEFMWARPGLGHRMAGFNPTKTIKYSPTDNYHTHRSTYVDATPEQVFALFSDHSQMSDWAGVEVKLLKPGSDDGEGVGLERLIDNKIKEQIICWQPPHHMRYRITEGGPFNNYIGEITVKAQGKGAQVTCINRFRAKVPGTGWLLKMVVGQFVTKVLSNIKHTAQRKAVTDRSG